MKTARCALLLLLLGLAACGEHGGAPAVDAAADAAAGGPDVPDGAAAPDAVDAAAGDGGEVAGDAGPAPEIAVWRAALAETAACPQPTAGPPPRRRTFCGAAVAPGDGALAVEGPGAEGLDLAADVLRHLPSLHAAEGDADLRLWLADLDAFGAPAELVLDGPEAHVVAVRAAPDGGGLRALVLSRTAAGRRCALQRLESLYADRGAHPQLTETVLADAPAVPLRVMIEGFYGPPWSPEARLDLVAYAGQARLNAYLLAAKHDPANVLLWDWPLLPSRLQQMAELAAAGREHGVRLCVAISPGQTVEFAAEADRAAATERFRQLHGVGVDCFVLAFDDVAKDLRGADPATYAGYAEAQADFVVDVLERTRAFTGEGALFVYVPNDYWTEAAAASPDLATVAAALPDWVGVAWTGAQICAPAITAADAAAFAAHVGRPPVLGDNDLVKDGDTVSGGLAVAPYAPREPALAAALAGFGVNVMPLAYASKLGLWTASEWAWNPADYDPQEALRRAAQTVARDDGSVASVLRFAPFSELACPAGERLPLWDATDLAACRQALAGADPAGVRAACDPAPGEALAAPVFEQGLIDEGFRRDVRPWADTLAHCQGLVQDGLALALGAAGGGPPAEDAVAAVEAAWEADCLNARERLRLAELDALLRAALAYARAETAGP